MATTTTITKLLFRRGNDSDRQQTILASGEPGWTLDTGRLWIGDGRTPGGYPALSGTDYHLHYTDAGGDPNSVGELQRLDINVQGLSATLAGHGVAPTMQCFHPTDEVLDTDYQIQITGKYVGTDASDILYTGNKDFAINRQSPGKIVLGDLLTIDSFSKAITFNTDVEAFNVIADKVNFAEGDETFIEDKSWDFNVPIKDGVRQLPGSPDAKIATAERTGIYLTHMGNLSAGRLAVAESPTQEGWNTLWLQPPVYDEHWDSVIASNLDRTLSTSNWNGWLELSDTDTTTTQYNSKPIAIKSVRPGNVSGWEGNAHLVLESGLIVYGSGDERGGKGEGRFNGYLMNQSVDSGAVPTFKGINISGDDSVAIGVDSGGTGRKSLTPGGVLIADNTDPTGPIQSLAIGKGDLVTGDKNGKAVITTLHTDTWLDVETTDSGGIKLLNVFGPEYLYGDSNVATAKTNYYNKWYRIATETGNIIPLEPQEELKIVGDVDITTDRDPNNTLKGRQDIKIKKSGTQGINVTHIRHAYDHVSTLKSGGRADKDSSWYTVHAGAASKSGSWNDDEGLFPGKGAPTLAQMKAYDHGYVFNSVKLNAAGHIVELTSRNLDWRYAQHDAMGTNSRNTTRVKAPSDFTSLTPTISDGSTVTNNTQHATILSKLKFNDYGTINSYSTYNLGGAYYNKTETDSALDALKQDLLSIDQNFFKNDEDSQTLGTTAIKTKWLNGSQVQFGSSNFGNSKIYETDSGVSGDPCLMIEAGKVNAAASEHAKTRRMAFVISGTENQDQNSFKRDFHFSGEGGTQPIAQMGHDNHQFFCNGLPALNFNEERFSFFAENEPLGYWDDGGIRLLKGKFSGEASTVSRSPTSLNLDFPIALRHPEPNGNTGKVVYHDSLGQVTINPKTGHLKCKKLTTDEGGFVPTGGGNFTGAVGTKYGTGETLLTVDGNWSAIEQKAKHGGFIDFGALQEDWNGRFLYSMGLKTSLRSRGFSLALNGHNGNQAYFLGGDNYEMFKVGTDGTSIAKKCIIGGDLCVGRWDQNDAQQEGGQINISDPGEVQDGQSQRTWVIDNFIDKDNNYKLGANAHMLRFFRQGIPGSFADADKGFVVIKNDGTLKAKRDIIAFHSSDKSLKDNLTPIPDALDKITTLTGYEFDWNDKQDTYTGHDVGVVAQEVEQVMPEVVNTREDGTKAVRYEKLVPLLIESIKELTAKVEKLESQLK